MKNFYPPSFHWSDKDVWDAWDGMRWKWDVTPDMWRRKESRQTSVSFLRDMEKMANSSSSHVFPSLTPALAHRAEVLENPLQVSLFNFETFWQGEIKN